MPVTLGIGTSPDELGVESQHFLDVGRVRVERLARRVARQDVRLVESAEMMHDAFAYSPVGIAQAHDRPGTDLAARNAAWISRGVLLSHVGLA